MHVNPQRRSTDSYPSAAPAIRPGDRWQDSQGDVWEAVHTDDGVRLKLVDERTHLAPPTATARTQEYVLQNYGRLSLIWRDGRTASGLYIDPPVLPKRPGGRKW